MVLILEELEVLVYVIGGGEVRRNKNVCHRGSKVLICYSEEEEGVGNLVR